MEFRNFLEDYLQQLFDEGFPKTKEEEMEFNNRLYQRHNISPSSVPKALLASKELFISHLKGRNVPKVPGWVRKDRKMLKMFTKVADDCRKDDLNVNTSKGFILGYLQRLFDEGVPTVGKEETQFNRRFYSHCGFESSNVPSKIYSSKIRFSKSLMGHFPTPNWISSDKKLLGMFKKVSADYRKKVKKQPKAKTLLTDFLEYLRGNHVSRHPTKDILPAFCRDFGYKKLSSEEKDKLTYLRRNLLVGRMPSYIQKNATLKKMAEKLIREIRSGKQKSAHNSNQNDGNEDDEIEEEDAENSENEEDDTPPEEAEDEIVLKKKKRSSKNKERDETISEGDENSNELYRTDRLLLKYLKHLQKQGAQTSSLAILSIFYRQIGSLTDSEKKKLYRFKYHLKKQQYPRWILADRELTKIADEVSKKLSKKKQRKAAINLRDDGENETLPADQEEDLEGENLLEASQEFDEVSNRPAREPTVLQSHSNETLAEKVLPQMASRENVLNVKTEVEAPVEKLAVYQENRPVELTVQASSEAEQNPSTQNQFLENIANLFSVNFQEEVPIENRNLPAQLAIKMESTNLIAEVDLQATKSQQINVKQEVEEQSVLQERTRPEIEIIELSEQETVNTPRNKRRRIRSDDDDKTIELKTKIKKLSEELASRNELVLSQSSLISSLHANLNIEINKQLGRE